VSSDIVREIEDRIAFHQLSIEELQKAKENIEQVRSLLDNPERAPQPQVAPKRVSTPRSRKLKEPRGSLNGYKPKNSEKGYAKRIVSYLKRHRHSVIRLSDITNSTGMTDSQLVASTMSRLASIGIVDRVGLGTYKVVDKKQKRENGASEPRRHIDRSGKGGKPTRRRRIREFLSTVSSATLQQIGEHLGMNKKETAHNLTAILKQIKDYGEIERLETGEYRLTEAGKA
jgi:hypothetical protein